MNLQYRLVEGEVVSEPLTAGELQRLRDKAPADKCGMRSCWNCNPSHARFLENVLDDFLFRCFSCGRIYFNGADLTEEQ